MAMPLGTRYDRPHVSDAEDHEDFVPRPMRRTYSKSADDVLTSKEHYAYAPPQVNIHNETNPERLEASIATRRVATRTFESLAKDCRISLLRSTNICFERSHKQQRAEDKDAFRRTGEMIKDQAFKLDIWLYEANVGTTIETVFDNVTSATIVRDILQRLQKRTLRMEEICKTVRPRDVNAPTIPTEYDDESTGQDGYDSDFEGVEYREEEDELIQTHLNGIQTQLQTLGRLTTPLRELADQDSEGSREQARLIKEVNYFFGSETALKRFKPDPRFVGNQALEEAKAKPEAGNGGKLPKFSDYIAPRPAANTYLTPESAGMRPRGKSLDQPRHAPSLPYGEEKTEYKLIRRRARSPDRSGTTGAGRTRRAELLDSGSLNRSDKEESFDRRRDDSPEGSWDRGRVKLDYV